MRNVTLFPFPRSAFGLDRVLEDSFFAEPGPAWDLIKVSDDQSRVVLAVPGFGQDELEVVQDGLELVIRSVEGENGTREAGGEVLRRGIAKAAFERRFRLADHVRVAGADLALGLLTVTLLRETPEALKPRRIDIAGQMNTAGVTDQVQAA